MPNTNKKENEKKDVNKNVEEVKGELTYENKVIQKIIGFSLENISGLLAVDGGFFSNLTDKLINTDNVTSGVNVEVGKEQVAVDLNIIVEYKKNVPELYQEIKKVITNDISNIKELHDADSVSLQDRVTNVVESTGEFASEKFEAAKTGISEGFSTAKEKVEDGIEAVKDKANDDDKEDEKASKSKEKKRVQ